MIQCLLSIEGKDYEVDLKTSANADWLSFDEARAYLASHPLMKRLNLDFDRDELKVFDSDFKQYVIVHEKTQIGNLSKMNVTKQSDVAEKSAM